MPDGTHPHPASSACDDDRDETVESLRLQLKESSDRAEHYREGLLRARAEIENLRKQTTRRIEDAHKYALQEFIRDLLPVKDGLEAGLASVGGRMDADAASLREGIELTLKNWDELLARIGVEELDPLGQTFDPELHQAISMRAAGSDEQPNSVVEITQKGYLLNGRLIRPAMVVVADRGADSADTEV